MARSSGPSTTRSLTELTTYACRKVWTGACTLGPMGPWRSPPRSGKGRHYDSLSRLALVSGSTVSYVPLGSTVGINFTLFLFGKSTETFYNTSVHCPRRDIESWIILGKPRKRGMETYSVQAVQTLSHSTSVSRATKGCSLPSSSIASAK
jgi:hypothetical protein